MQSTRSMLGSTQVVLMFFVAMGCAHEVKPDSMSAEEHRQAASRDDVAAQNEVTKAVVAAPPPNLGQNPGGIPNGYTYPVDSYNPTTEHMVHAQALEAHAREHQQAAQKLETFVEDECKDFPPTTRASCPMLGPVTQISDIKDGVRVTFAKNARVDAVAAHMRCHLAYAKAYGFDTLTSCPLYVRGLEIQKDSDGQSIDLIAHDKKTTDQIRSRSREEAMLVSAANH